MLAVSEVAVDPDVDEGEPLAVVAPLQFVGDDVA
jgi:hypothetical protein